eukprot:CAMPEP_0115675086 /NCGR_PEP_ID=MMETSP0272-20121206/53967_1 /TAXON_ID=71861 /ORGANISM="Scrippsiella trochoidea, Strain CCMP3099" /LENGTH=220 /DNA_ID=CAMNT_0003114039 /DNA_START=55 /DNA_END=714 /DNA_ORIENTATION=+
MPIRKTGGTTTDRPSAAALAPRRSTASARPRDASGTYALALLQLLQQHVMPRAPRATQAASPRAHRKCRVATSATSRTASKDAAQDRNPSTKRGPRMPATKHLQPDNEVLAVQALVSCLATEAERGADLPSPLPRRPYQVCLRPQRALLDEEALWREVAVWQELRVEVRQGLQGVAQDAVAPLRCEAQVAKASCSRRSLLRDGQHLPLRAIAKYRMQAVA